MLAAIEQRAPWLATHVKALASGRPKPEIDVPAQFAAVIEQVWEAVS